MILLGTAAIRILRGSGAFFVGALLLASGCDTDEEGASGVQSYEDPLYQIKRVYSGAWCDCYSEGNYDSHGQCLERHPGQESNHCQKMVTTQEAGAADRLECLLAVAEAEAQCLGDAGCGDEEMVVAMCREQAMASSAQCPEYPEDIQTQLTDCEPPESFWMVADEGVIFGIDALGVGEAEPQSTSADLNAIVCDGAERAWIVGDGGIVLSTTDAGDHWSTGQAPTDSTLRALAQHHPSDLIAVGERGTAVRSVDGGVSWTRLDAPERDFTGVAATVGGAWLLSDDSGTLWRYREDDGFMSVFTSNAGPLFGVAADHHSPYAAAVGSGGAIFQSPDAGETWTSLASPEGEALRAVNIPDAGTLVAVGDRGIAIRIDPDGMSSSYVGERGRSLLGLHITSSGHGAIVGEAGTFLQTHDGGVTWTSVPLGIDADLRGLDQPFATH